MFSALIALQRGNHDKVASSPQMRRFGKEARRTILFLGSNITFARVLKGLLYLSLSLCSIILSHRLFNSASAPVGLRLHGAVASPPFGRVPLAHASIRVPSLCGKRHLIQGIIIMYVQYETYTLFPVFISYLCFLPYLFRSLDTCIRLR